MDYEAFYSSNFIYENKILTHTTTNFKPNV